MQLDTEKIRFTLLPDNIVQIDCAPRTVMTLEDGKLSTRMVAELTKGEALPLLCDLTNVVQMSQECRRYFAGSDHAAVFSQCALIITSPVSKIIGNFFLGANKPIKPTKLFTCRENGLEWLKTHKQ